MKTGRGPVHVWIRLVIDLELSHVYIWGLLQPSSLPFVISGTPPRVNLGAMKRQNPVCLTVSRCLVRTLSIVDALIQASMGRGEME